MTSPGRPATGGNGSARPPTLTDLPGPRKPVPPASRQDQGALARRPSLRSLLHRSHPHPREVPQLRRDPHAPRPLARPPAHLPRLRRHHDRLDLHAMQTRNRTVPRKSTPERSSIYSTTARQSSPATQPGQPHGCLTTSPSNKISITDSHGENPDNVLPHQYSAYLIR
jgi:hypothetical protein